MNAMAKTAHWVFMLCLLSLSQAATAVKFAHDYKISIDGKDSGHLQRKVNKDKQVEISMQLAPLQDDQHEISGFEFLMQRMQPEHSVLQGSLRHLQSFSAQAAALSAGEISIILTEAEGQPLSATYHVAGSTYRDDRSEAVSADEGCVLIGGSNEVYGVDAEGALTVETITPNDADEGISQETVVEEQTCTDMSSLMSSAIADLYQQPESGHYFIFGTSFEQLASELTKSQGDRNRIYSLTFPVFPAFAILPGEASVDVVPASYAQVLTYNPDAMTITQQDPPDDENPCGLITTYTINQNGIISTITMNDGRSVVVFAMEQNAQPSGQNDTGISVPPLSEVQTEVQNSTDSPEGRPDETTLLQRFIKVQITPQERR